MNQMLSSSAVDIDPLSNCDFCPRLSVFIGSWRELEPNWHNAPVPTFFPEDGKTNVRLLIVGLAPGLRGANRTGRPFTGDFAGKLLYSTLIKSGLAKGHFDSRADDGLILVKTAITNAVRCVPPGNKPTSTEITNCLRFLSRTIQSLPDLKAILTLGLIAHKSVIRALGGRLSKCPFIHGGRSRVAEIEIFSTYHCSRYNTNTRRLTEESFIHIVSQAADFIQEHSCP